MKLHGEHTEQGQGLVSYTLLFGAVLVIAVVFFVVVGTQLGQV